ncbi:MAG: ligase-associated DNA damage response endonuclease PdeM [Phycisphaerales bacterium]|nr:ligase-associated DNA damage response endonuclease PdeM [Phycisphaerales bacterium]
MRGSQHTRVGGQAGAEGEPVILMPQRGVFWPARSTLLVADLHLGKSDAFRASGIAIPTDAGRGVLALVEDAIRETGAARVLVLGDLLHAPAGLTDELIQSVAAWRRRQTAAFELIPGNHDRRVERAAEAWGMHVHPGPVREGPFEFRHEPPEGEKPGLYVWCGHLHPAFVLSSSSDRLKLPAFLVGPRVGVLPACTPFAAGAPVRPARGDRVFIIADGRVVQV